jgi:hypothetical protein
MTEPADTKESPIQYTTGLTCHPETYSPAVQGIVVRVGWRQDGALTLTYTLTGDCTRLRIPPPRPAAKADSLWQHTCFEAFISVKGDFAYRELNFSPSGEWAVYYFRGYRDRFHFAEEEAAPEILVRRAESGLVLEANIRLPLQFTLRPLQLGLSAVIEDDWGKRSYWALMHPPGKPDFHHPEAFALRVVPLNGVTTKRERP